MNQENVISLFKQVKQDVSSFLFPKNCASCKIRLPDGIENLCLNCFSELHYTYFESYKGSSPLDELFWGRMQLSSTFSLLYFTKKSNTQAILHNIKYQNNQALAKAMGNLMGKKLHVFWTDDVPDYFVPVPLHPKKKHIRGYNQSELLANGISEILKIPVENNLLKRTRNTSTQTKKNKFDRWNNVSENFKVVHPELYENKHICIVDDVITTGSTLESCVNQLQKNIINVKISVISLALAK